VQKKKTPTNGYSFMGAYGVRNPNSLNAILLGPPVADIAAEMFFSIFKVLISASKFILNSIVFAVETSHFCGCLPPLQEGDGKLPTCCLIKKVTCRTYRRQVAVGKYDKYGKLPYKTRTSNFRSLANIF
jgi:hypothetical protein